MIGWRMPFSRTEATSSSRSPLSKLTRGLRGLGRSGLGAHREAVGAVAGRHLGAGVGQQRREAAAEARAGLVLGHAHAVTLPGGGVRAGSPPRRASDRPGCRRI